MGVATQAACLTLNGKENASESASPTPPPPAPPAKPLPVPAPSRSSFQLEVSGLPHRSSPFGTGVPDYIDADLARRAIEHVFKDNGYRFSGATPYVRDGVEVILDGYDPKKKVGYLFAEMRNLDSDAFVRWWEDEEKGVPTERKLNALLFGASDDSADVKKLRAEIEAAKSITDPAKREFRFKELLEQRRRHLSSLEEIKRIEKQGQEFIAIISQYDRRFVIDDSTSVTDWEEESRLRSLPREELLKVMRESKERRARKAIERLEQSVREYIAWARSQGAQ
jgi:hypothetical protein